MDMAYLEERTGMKGERYFRYCKFHYLLAQNKLSHAQ